MSGFYYSIGLNNGNGKTESLHLPSNVPYEVALVEIRNFIKRFDGELPRDAIKEADLVSGGQLRLALADLEKAQAKIRELAGSNGGLVAANNRLSKKYSEDVGKLASDLENVRYKLTCFKIQNSSLIEENDKLKELVNKKEEDLQKAHLKLKKVYGSKGATKAALMRTQEKLESAESRIANFEGISSALKKKEDKLTDAQARLASLRMENRRLDSQLRNSHNELRQKGTEITRLEGEIQDLKSKTSGGLGQRYDELHQKFKDMEHRLEKMEEERNEAEYKLKCLSEGTEAGVKEEVVPKTTFETFREVLDGGGSQFATADFVTPAVENSGMKRSRVYRDFFQWSEGKLKRIQKGMYRRVN